MGGIGNCCCGECDMTLESLPTISITGMSVSNDWHWIADCCAEINFVFDDVQALSVIDAGDVMTYDKTEVCTTEMVAYDLTCGEVTQEFWEDLAPPSGRGYITADEPPYDCCDSITPTQVHTLTKTARSRGGQRFLISIRPIGISVVIKKVTDYVCSPAGAVTRYVMRSRYQYYGEYEYRNYGQNTTVYTTTADAACWDKPADTTSGYYPFDIDDPYTLGSTGVVDVSFCREKVLTAIPSVETSYTFAIGDVPNVGCVFVECVDCPPDSEICFSSGPTGDEEPTSGFCDATIITEESDGAYYLQLCLPHKYYWWSEPVSPLLFGFPPCVTLFENMFGDPPTFMQDAVLCCSGYAGVATTSPNYNAARCVIPSYEYPSWTTLTAGGPESGILDYCEYPTLKAGESLIDCWPTQVCPACPTGVADQIGDSDPNIVVAAGTQTVNKAMGSRIVEITRTVTCSGYVEQEACIDFAAWTIVLQEGL